jgi:NAD(P)-dependent dehydrogenase (short-subunit alcohol dehydrogenase family)
MKRTAIVTGASRGIGRAIVLALAEEGFDVAAVALPEPDRMTGLEKAVTATGRRFAPYALDIADLDAHGAVLDDIAGTFGEIDGLVNDAGVSVLRILQPGAVRKLVERVERITFRGASARDHGQEVLYVTERAVFRLGESGLELIEIAPGAEVGRDILPHMGFAPRIGPLRPMPLAVFE